MIRMIDGLRFVYPGKREKIFHLFCSVHLLFSFFHKTRFSPSQIGLLFLLAYIHSSAAHVSMTAQSTGGAYLGARFGYTYNHHSCVDMAIECDRSDAGYGIFAGYDFNNPFSLELSGTKLGDTNVIYPNITLKGELSTIDLSIKYSRPLSKKIQAFGKLGIAYWDGKITGWDTTLTDSGERPTAGAGLQFPFFTRSLARIEYHYFDQLGNNWMGYTDAHAVSFSLVWNFSSTD